MGDAEQVADNIGVASQHPALNEMRPEYDAVLREAIVINVAPALARAREAGYRAGIEDAANVAGDFGRFWSINWASVERGEAARKIAAAVRALSRDRSAEGSAAIEPQEDR